MKTKVMNLILAAAALLTAAACTNDDSNVAVDDDTRVAARITAAMADGTTATPDAAPGARAATPSVMLNGVKHLQPQSTEPEILRSAQNDRKDVATRAVGTQWNGDHIGVIVQNSPGSDMAQRYRNARYTTTSVTFAPLDVDNTIYFDDSPEPVKFMAYAPYQPSATVATLPGTNGNGKVYFDMLRQTTPAEQEAVDVLLAPPTTASKSNPTVSFQFNHIMTRLVLNIQTPAAYGFSPDDVKHITAVKIGGLRTTGFIEVVDNRFAFGSDESSRKEEWDITQNVNRVETRNGVTQRVYTLIIPSVQHVKDKAGQDIDAIPLSITFDEQEYKNTKDLKGNPDNPGSFLFAKSYEYTIRLKKTGIEVTGATITDWVDAVRQ